MPNSMTTLIRHGVRLACAAAMAAGLAACDASTVDLSVQEQTSSATTQPMTAVASLGAVNAATANFYTANGATLLASGTTNANGSVTVQVPSTHTGPVIVEVLGDDVDAIYFDEAAGTLLPLAAGNRLRALVPQAGGAVAVTTLTELAYQIAVANNLLPISAADVSATNAAVLAALAPGLDSLLTVPTAFDASTGAGDLDDTPAGRHALVLAALANLAAGNATPALAVLDALIADLSDGQLNANVADVPYTDFIAEMRTALTSVANSFGTTALQNVAAGQAPASTTVGADNGGGNGGGDAPNGTTSPGTVAAALVSQYTLTAIENQPGSPYSDGDMVMAIVSDSTLQIDDGPVLTDPFVRSINGNPQTTEIIWLDTATNLEYALSNNETGVFNEINIGDAANPISQGIPGFLGQLVDQSTGGGEGPANIELVTAVAGTYTVTEVLEGSHQRGTVTIGDDGAIDYDTGLSFTPDQYEAIFDRLDCCMRVSVEFNEQGDGNKPRVDLFVDADGALERVVYFVDGFGSDGSEVRVGGDVSEPDPADPQAGNTGMSKVVGNGFTGVIDGTEYTYNGEVISYANDSIRLDGLDPDDIVQRWRLFAPRQVGTFSCDESGDESVLQKLGTDAGVGSGNGDCVIKIVQAGPVLEGYFTGNLAGAAGSPLKAVTDGYFFFDPDAPADGGSDPAGDAELDATDTGVSGVVDGVRTTIDTDATFNDLGDGYIGVSVTDTDGPGGAQRRWTMRVPAEVGAHSCQFAGGERSFNTEITLFDGANFYAASADTGCTITVTTLTANRLEAGFNGTAAVQRDGGLEAVAITDGLVRLAAPAGFDPDGTQGTGPNGTTTAATVNAALVSQYTLTAVDNQPGSPYSDGEMVLVIVGADDTVQVGAGPALVAPFIRQVDGAPRTREIIWLDADADLEFALADNDAGVFETITIGNAADPMTDGVPAVLGRLVAMEDGGDGGTGGGSNGGASANACAHPELLETGTRFMLEYRSDDAGSGNNVQFTDEREVTGPSMFNGMQTIRTDGTTVSTDSASGSTATSQTETHTRSADSGLTFLTVGVVTQTSVSGFSITSTVTNEPPVEVRYDLDAGDDYTQTYTTTVESDTGFGTNTVTSDTTSTTTYVGREPVTVPAGTFDACRFEVDTTSTSGGSTASSSTTRWVHVDTGVELRNESGDTTTVLISGSIDGSAIR